MSFLKKLLGQEFISPEEKDKALAKKEEKHATEMKLMEKHFGKSTGFFNKLNFSIYKQVINYFEEHTKYQDEEVLLSIPAEYDKTKKREMKGMLIATSHRLIFVTCGIGHGIYTESFDYRKMNGISLAPDGFNQKELLIDYGRSRKVFDDIVNDDQFKQFLNIVNNKIKESKRSALTAKSSIKTTLQDNKYEKLAQIAKLRDQGILTEEEFQIEKQKILNS